MAVLDTGMQDGLNIGDVVIYTSGHSITVHDNTKGMHYIVTEEGKREFYGRCNWALAKLGRAQKEICMLPMNPSM